MAKATKAKADKASALGLVGGAAAGAAAGSLAGPLGAAVGAVVGGVAGANAKTIAKQLPKALPKLTRGTKGKISMASTKRKARTSGSRSSKGGKMTQTKRQK